MGYGYGAAIGAAFASKKQVVLITSDGSFHMNFNETITAVRYNLPIKIFLMNNKSLGMVRQWQKEFYDNRCPFTKLNSQIDYVKLMEALGAKGFTLDKDEDINLIVKKALNEK
jgi:acetolactate synthase-1/2/3 large subunit